MPHDRGRGTRPELWFRPLKKTLVRSYCSLNFTLICLQRNTGTEECLGAAQVGAGGLDGKTGLVRAFQREVTNPVDADEFVRYLPVSGGNFRGFCIFVPFGLGTNRTMRYHDGVPFKLKSTVWLLPQRVPDRYLQKSLPSPK